MPRAKQATSSGPSTRAKNPTTRASGSPSRMACPGGAARWSALAEDRTDGPEIGPERVRPNRAAPRRPGESASLPGDRGSTRRQRHPGRHRQAHLGPGSVQSSRGDLARSPFDSVTCRPPSGRPWPRPTPARGEQWTIPEAVGRRFCPAPVPSRASSGSRGRDRSPVRRSGGIRTRRDRLPRLRRPNRGTSSRHESDAREGQRLSHAMKMIGGVGSYDIRAGQMLSLTWVWDGRWPGITRPR